MSQLTISGQRLESYRSSKGEVRAPGASERRAVRGAGVAQFDMTHPRPLTRARRLRRATTTSPTPTVTPSASRPFRSHLTNLHAMRPRPGVQAPDGLGVIGERQRRLPRDHQRRRSPTRLGGATRVENFSEQVWGYQMSAITRLPMACPVALRPALTR